MNKIAQTLNVWYIDLHLSNFYAKCRKYTLHLPYIECAVIVVASYVLTTHLVSFDSARRATVAVPRRRVVR